MKGIGTGILAGLVLGLNEYKSDAVENYTKAGEAVAEGTKTGIANKQESVNIQGRTLLGNVYLAMQTAIGGAHGTAFNAIGTAICAGIAQGIRNGTSAVTIAATNAAISAYNAAKRSLQINSPSKVFEKLFQYVPLGAAKGIDDNASKVEESVSRLADSLASPDIAARMQAAVSRNASGFADILADSGSVHATETQNQQPIDYNQLAKAIWDEAPDIGFNVDSVRMADLLEPRISEKQATNTQNKVRRGE